MKDPPHFHCLLMLPCMSVDCRCEEKSKPTIKFMSPGISNNEFICHNTCSNQNFVLFSAQGNKIKNSLGMCNVNGRL